MLSLSLPSVARNFGELSLSRAPRIIIKRIVIWGIKRPDFRSDVVKVEILSQSTLCSLFVLLPNIESPRSHRLDPGQHNLFQALDVDLYIESEAMWEDEYWHNITIARNTYYNIFLLNYLILLIHLYWKVDTWCTQ